MKKETLEDFTKEVLQDEFFTNIAEYGKAERLIEIGAKWQQERSYSKEEVYTIQQISDLFIPIGKGGYIDDYLDYRLFSKEQPKLNFKEWFEKFKNK
jgi:hypothetical protein